MLHFNISHGNKATEMKMKEILTQNEELTMLLKHYSIEKYSVEKEKLIKEILFYKDSLFKTVNKINPAKFSACISLTNVLGKSMNRSFQPNSKSD